VLVSGCDATVPGATVDTEPDVTAVEPEVGAVEGEAAEGEAVQPEVEATAATDVTEAIAGTDSTGAGTMGGVGGIPAGTFVRGQTLLGWNFENVDGEVSGEIEDFFFDMNTGRIPFVMIEYGGILDIGDTDVAVPLSAFRWGSENELILNFDEQALESFPDVGNDWPDWADPAWDDEVGAFWNNLGIDPGPNLDEASGGTLVRASALTGFTMVDLGVGSGAIQDVIVNLAEGRVHYVLAGFGTDPAVDPAISQDAFILPLEVFDLQGTEAGLGSELRFDANVTEEMLLTAPRWDPLLYDQTASYGSDWNEQIRGYWQGFGFDE
jgi:sporulation protein YlmC with PRC-barrel domain